MGALGIVEQWDAALRAGDWEAARRLLADDAEYHTPEADEDMNIDCGSAEEIIDLMTAWKGQASDVVVVEWAEHGNKVLARLRQPDWGDDADWYQVITVEGSLITGLTDFREAASARATLN